MEDDIVNKYQIKKLSQIKKNSNQKNKNKIWKIKKLKGDEIVKEF